MKNTYSAKLKELRVNLNFSQTEVTDKLRSLGIQVTQSSLSRWEVGLNNPSIQQFIGLCGIYGISDVYRTFGFNEALRPECRLNAEGEKKLLEYKQLLIASKLYTDEDVNEARLIPIPKRMLPMYDVGASAGTGQFLDSDSYELVEVPDDVPDSANFGLHVCGDSMEPTLIDGQDIWVHMQPTLENGEVGIFFLDGNAFVKEYMKSEDGVALISHNKAYDPIELTPDSEARIYGRVVFPQC